MALIYLDAWGVKRGPHGIARYCRSLAPAVLDAAPHHDFVIIRPPRLDAGDDIVPRGSAREVELRLPRTDWATLLFRPWLEHAFKRHGRPDLYHSLFHMLPLSLKAGSRAPQRVVLTLHDLIALDYANEVKRNWLQTQWVKRFDPLVIPYALRHADHVICDSHATRQRATEWVPLNRSTTVHCGVADMLLAAAPERRESQLPFAAHRMRPYIAALGPTRPYKNVGCVVRALAVIRRRRPDLRLVLIGGDGGASDEIRRIGLGSAVLVTPPATDAEFRSLIEAAEAFVVPSRAEGFGLPLLEAMAIGVPAVASDIAVLREIGGSAPLWFSPDDPAQLAAEILRVVSDDGLRNEMIRCGRAHAATFTWRRTARETVAVYERVLATI